MPETDSNIIPIKTKHGCPRWVRSLTAAAAVLALLIVGSVTANAFGFNIWKAVVQWTQETFHFGNGNGDNNLRYTSLQEALEKGKVTVPLAPTWFPDGYELEEIKVETTPVKKRYTAIYTKEKESLRITVQDHLDEDPVFVEQSDGLIEEYKYLGITYYLLENNKNIQAVWVVDSYECCISGEVTIDELKMMISSIEKG